MIVQRVNAGLDRARAKGVKLGRPAIDRKTEEAIRKAIAKGGMGKHKIAKLLGVGSGTVARVKTAMEAAG
jgi:DNA invertase Pin-like site-specific DNA recombinase